LTKYQFKLLSTLNSVWYYCWWGNALEPQILRHRNTVIPKGTNRIIEIKSGNRPGQWDRHKMKVGLVLTSRLPSAWFHLDYSICAFRGYKDTVIHRHTEPPENAPSKAFPNLQLGNIFAFSFLVCRKKKRKKAWDEEANIYTL
jgi:hypothetical protein